VTTRRVRVTHRLSLFDRLMVGYGAITAEIGAVPAWRLILLSQKAAGNTD
jgi:hypothetical protein